MRYSKLFTGCALSFVLFNVDSDMASTNKNSVSIPAEELEAVKSVCARKNPLVMALNQETGTFTVYRCDPRHPARIDTMMGTRALWGKTTKPGTYDNVYPGKPEDAQNYPRGIGLLFNGDQAVHGVYIPEKETRLKSLETATLDDNVKSKGCINVSNEFFFKMVGYYSELWENGHIKKYPPMVIVGPK